MTSGLTKGDKEYRIAFFIIYSFMIIYALSTVSYILFSNEELIMIALKLLSLMTFLFLTYLILKKNRVALWIMTILILCTGVNDIFTALYLMTERQQVLKIIFFIIGVYFTFGGLLLIPLGRKLKLTISETK